MKKLIGNRTVCVGSFSGPDIEEGTFHHFDADSLNLHQKDTKKCPCPPVESHEAKTSADSNENDEKSTSNND